MRLGGATLVAKAVGLKELPATVESLTDEEAHELRIVENACREDPHPLGEAEAYEALLAMKDHEARDEGQLRHVGLPGGLQVLVQRALERHRERGVVAESAPRSGVQKRSHRASGRTSGRPAAAAAHPDTSPP
jgi:ParB-like chromosome segregation protein Spo0J